MSPKAASPFFLTTHLSPAQSPSPISLRPPTTAPPQLLLFPPPSICLPCSSPLCVHPSVTTSSGPTPLPATPAWPFSPQAQFPRSTGLAFLLQPCEASLLPFTSLFFSRHSLSSQFFFSPSSFSNSSSAKLGERVGTLGSIFLGCVWGVSGSSWAVGRRGPCLDLPSGGRGTVGTVSGSG